MLERDIIEEGLRGVLAMLEELQTGIYFRQGAAVRKIIESPADKARVISEARKDISRFAGKQKKLADATVQRDLAALIRGDIEDQLALYRKSYRAGIVQSKPIAPKRVLAGQIKNVAQNMVFVRDTIDRVAAYGGSKLATVVEMALDDKLKGEATDKIARAASRLIMDEGVKIKLPSGRNVHDVYGYMRTHLTTAISRESAETQMTMFESIDMPDGLKWFETSSHWGAREEHAEWQGRIFESRADFERATDYGEITGIGGINCRHTFYSYIPGVSKQRFFPKPEKENERRYEARQTQKRLESAVRKWKAEDEINRGLGLEVKNKDKIKRTQAVLRGNKQDMKAKAADYNAKAA